MKYTVGELIAALAKLPPELMVQIYHAPINAPVVQHLNVEETEGGSVLLDGYSLYHETPAEFKMEEHTPSHSHAADELGKENGFLKRTLAVLAARTGGTIQVPHAEFPSPETPDEEMHIFEDDDTKDLTIRFTK